MGRDEAGLDLPYEKVRDRGEGLATPKPGQMYSKNFNYKGMLKYAEGVNSKRPSR